MAASVVEGIEGIRVHGRPCCGASVPEGGAYSTCAAVDLDVEVDLVVEVLLLTQDERLVEAGNGFLVLEAIGSGLVEEVE